MLNNNLFSSLEEKSKKENKGLLLFLKNNVFQLSNINFILILSLVFFLFPLLSKIEKNISRNKIYLEVLKEQNIARNEATIELIRHNISTEEDLQFDKDDFEEKIQLIIKRNKEIEKDYEQGLTAEELVKKYKKSEGFYKVKRKRETKGDSSFSIN